MHIDLYISSSMLDILIRVFFFFNDTATTEIYTLSLHDALPICMTGKAGQWLLGALVMDDRRPGLNQPSPLDRKSTRLNSSHGYISYAVFCLKKKKTTKTNPINAINKSRRRSASQPVGTGDTTAS